MYICFILFFLVISFLQSSGLRSKLKDAIKRSEAESELAQEQAARFDLLLPEEAG